MQDKNLAWPKITRLFPYPEITNGQQGSLTYKSIDTLVFHQRLILELAIVYQTDGRPIRRGGDHVCAQFLSVMIWCQGYQLIPVKAGAVTFLFCGGGRGAG